MKGSAPSSADHPDTSGSSISLRGRDRDDARAKKPRGYDYEVFLSFRGEDTRTDFTDHLYSRLVEAGITVFRDNNELQVGDEIGTKLLHAIGRSKVLIPILSRDYASSSWCLRELAQMVLCRKNMGSVILPIFYKVKPSHVRNQIGIFGESFNSLGEEHFEEDVKEWRQALTEVASLKGWESEKTAEGHEVPLIKLVVTKVLSELKKAFQLIVPKHLVGLDDHVAEVMRMVDPNIGDTQMVGIYGMGGVGKTTLAKVIYNNLSSQFEHRSFVANIRESSRCKGLECLQNQLINDILKAMDQVSSVDEGINFICSRFAGKKVLIFLDDVDNNKQLDALAGEQNWFEPGSRIIITTRDKSVLDRAYVKCTYKLNEMGLDQSLILFSRHAFRTDSPPRDFEIISSDVASTTGGLPLALEVIGSFLCGKKLNVWKDTLKKLLKIPDKEVQDQLKISYEALQREEQQMFLDIACFLIGRDVSFATYMWDDCDFFPERGLEILSLMSLIKIGDDGMLSMHDQLRDLGREIVRQENYEDPERRSRLWNPDEAFNVLDGNMGTEKIQALCLDKNGFGARFKGEQFEKLNKLRFLQLGGVNLVGDFQNLLPELKWLAWQGCPLEFVAINFPFDKLVILEISGSQVTEHWGGWKQMNIAADKLKTLNLGWCSELTTTPDLSAFRNLVALSLCGCVHLERIHPSIGDIKTLTSLDLRGCYELKELPAEVGRLEALEELLLNGTPVEEIPISGNGLKKLKSLSVVRCLSLAQIPGSIGRLSSLSDLNLRRCDKIAHLPDSIRCLMKLQRLLLGYCHNLGEIPDSIEKLESLIELDLSGTKISELPESIGHLHNLGILQISRSQITKLPRTITKLGKLEQLDASDCRRLEGEIPSEIGQLSSLKILRLRGTSISSLPKSILKLSSLQELDLQRCPNLRQVPELPSGLTTLRVTCQSPTFPPLSHLINLKDLSVDSCNSLESLPEFPSKLSQLSIMNCPMLRNLPDLSNLKHLSHLGLYRCYGLSEIKGINGLESLKALRVEGWSSRLVQVKGLLSLRGLRIDFQTLTHGNLVEIEGLDRLEWLEYLSLGKAAIERLDLSNLKRLKKLEADCSEDLVEIWVNGLKHLQTLNLTGCGGLKKINAANCENLHGIGNFEGLKSLQSLDISGCTSITIIDLCCPKNLRELHATNCEKLVRIEGLEGLKSLESLDISGCTSITGLIDLSCLKNLRDLHPANCEKIGGLWLNRCKFLQSLDISVCMNLGELYVANCEKLVEVRGLESLQRLVYLNMSGCTSVEKLPDISCLKTLKRLNINDCEKLNDIQSLEKFSSCQCIYIEGCKSLAKFPDVSKFEYLRNLKLRDCYELLEIPGLKESRYLMQIDISGCKSIEALPDLSACKNLQRLVARDCRKLTKLGGLEELELLQDLDISGCESLKIIPVLSGRLIQNYEEIFVYWGVQEIAFW